jgi:hypothetical protein
MSSLRVKGDAMSWKAPVHNQQFGENESIEIGKSQRLRKVGNDRLKNVLAMGPGLAKIIEKVWISCYFKSPAADLEVAKKGMLY